MTGHELTPPHGADGPEVRAYWDALHKDLAELELRGALGGIRAIIAERLAQVRAGDPLTGEYAAETELDFGYTARAAALLAAEIDRQEAGGALSVHGHRPAGREPDARPAGLHRPGRRKRARRLALGQ